MDTFENPAAVFEVEGARRANSDEQQRPEAADHHEPAPPDDESSVFDHAREIAQQKVDRASDGVLEGAVKIDVDVEATLRADWYADGLRGPVSPTPILEPWGLTSSLCFRIEWPPVHAPMQPPGLHIDGACTLDRLSIACTASQLSHLAQLLRLGAQPTVAHLHRTHRPAANASAADWWRYAIDAVCADLRAETIQVSWRWLRARVLMQRAYELAYHAHIVSTAHDTSSRAGRAPNGLSLTAPSAAAVDAAVAMATIAATAADDAGSAMMDAADRRAPRLEMPASVATRQKKARSGASEDAAAAVAPGGGSAAMLPNNASSSNSPPVVRRHSASFGAQPASNPRPFSASTRRVRRPG